MSKEWPSTQASPPQVPPFDKDKGDTLPGQGRLARMNRWRTDNPWHRPPPQTLPPALPFPSSRTSSCMSERHHREGSQTPSV
ncbi:hypothetical protein D187_004736 [Cystobacter fuscus DSM 2262]|uniref:Uncharacterized protein n=1 Tax=Cystobacter fuscus (strain ATCC 25194 / DSM 2262 / NBRC 100088 / M29) TaxID=1242864 RepID=S9P3I9_CYSF2|nr:hypothetical protein D187_004736 [Cystobacter fuscus DSM 2262]